MYPSMKKENMRYRGPMESEKINRFSLMQRQEAERLKQIFENLKGRFEALRESVMEGASEEYMINGFIPLRLEGMKRMSVEIKSQSEKIKKIKEV